MTCLVDTDVLVAYLSAREAKHTVARPLVASLVEGTWGAPWVTDFVLDEVFTLLMARRFPVAAVDRLAEICLGRPNDGIAPLIPCTRVSDLAFEAALPLFKRHYFRGLSFTDCTTLAVLAERRFSGVASFDRGFDGLVPRIAG